jgi:hypothetical protein
MATIAVLEAVEHIETLYVRIPTTRSLIFKINNIYCTMKIKEYKKYLDCLPKEFDDYEVVVSEKGEFDEENSFRIDKPIVKIFIDPETKELCIVVHE